MPTGSPQAVTPRALLLQAQTFSLSLPPPRPYPASLPVPRRCNSCCQSLSRLFYHILQVQTGPCWRFRAPAAIRHPLQKICAPRSQLPASNEEILRA